MPNSLTAAGLILATREELLANFTTVFRQIYGPDISISSDTPDGQLINIWVQTVEDLQDLVASVYNSVDPDNAIGVILDQRVAINGIQRQEGTKTVTPITLVNSQSVNLYGTDQEVEPPYTVSDPAGNRWLLEETELGVAAGTHVYSFAAEFPGQITTIPNTITVPVTIVLGVTSVNNPTSYTSLGQNEESDAALRIRRQKSVSLASQGYLQGLYAALNNIPGMISAEVFENHTGTTDSNGVPGHSIWVITSGTALDSDIANAIYTKRNAGCGMKGEESYNVLQVDGTLFTVFWDTVQTVNLFISFTATSLNGINPPNISVIKEGLPLSFVPGVAAEVNINALATQVQILDPNTLVTEAGFATGQEQSLLLSGVPASGSFIISYTGLFSDSINWNDSTSDIQTKIRGVAGLETAVISGTLASQEITIDLSSLNSVEALIFVSSNSLATSVPNPITITYDAHYTPTLTPSSKQYQFIVSSDRILVTPIVLSPETSSIPAGGIINFSAAGGFGTYTFSISINNSGGSINATTGVYEAGPTSSVTDTVQVIDQMGHITTSTVAVT